MDTTVLIIALFAVVIIAAFVVFRRRATGNISGPGGTGMTLDASNEPAPPTPGVKIAGAKSRGGGLTAQDDTGRGADVKDVEVEKDINVSSALPKGNSSPKA